MLEVVLPAEAQGLPLPVLDHDSAVLLAPCPGLLPRSPRQRVAAGWATGSHCVLAPLQQVSVSRRGVAPVGPSHGG